MKYTDHFSSQSADYSLYRPDYPQALFRYLASLCPCRALAWDCATGNGQAAIGLSRYFTRIIATDASTEQIGKAQSRDNIEYKTGRAEQSGIDQHSIDFVMVAQALHWFDFGSFYREAARVLKPGGLLAAVSYQLSQINADIDAVIDTFYRDIVSEYWPAERRHVEEAYRNIPFPLEEITTPDFQIEQNWTLDQFLGYLQSWSAVVYFEKERQQNPVDLIREKLGDLWGKNDTQKRICWPLTLRVGKFTDHANRADFAK